MLTSFNVVKVLLIEIVGHLSFRLIEVSQKGVVFGFLSKFSKHF